MFTVGENPVGAPEALLAAVIESSDDAIISKNLDGIVTSWNPGAERLFGFMAEEVLGRPVTILAPPGREEEMPRILRRIRNGEKVQHYETERRHKSGRIIPISLTVSPIRDRDGRIVGASKIARDISERRRSEERQNLLLHELNHRMKNTLAMVSAIASRTIAGSQSLEEFETAFSARIQAVARAHELLSSGFWQTVDLQDILEGAVSPFGGEDRVLFSGPSIKLKAKPALTLALVLHELTVNATKYGALSSASGHVAVEVAIASDHTSGDRIELRWAESGGPAVVPPTRRSFGCHWIERGVRAGLNGNASLRFDPDGVACTITFPYSSEIGVP